jgi:bla regulator protein blaR1
MAQLAAALAPFVQRFTVDQTGLSGGFDVELTWAPEPANAATPSSPVPAQSEPPGLSIFEALQGQLSLKLVSEKGPVHSLVIDRVEEPTGN